MEVLDDDQKKMMEKNPIDKITNHTMQGLINKCFMLILRRSLVSTFEAHDTENTGTKASNRHSTYSKIPVLSPSSVQSGFTGAMGRNPALLGRHCRRICFVWGGGGEI